MKEKKEKKKKRKKRAEMCISHFLLLFFCLCVQLADRISSAALAPWGRCTSFWESPTCKLTLTVVFGLHIAVGKMYEFLGQQSCRDYLVVCLF